MSIAIESLALGFRSIYEPGLMAVPDAPPARAVDEAAFRAVYQAEFGYVFTSLRRLGVPSKDLEDLAHDTFAAAWRRRNDFVEGRPVRPWLFGIAFRVASDFRKLARHRHEVVDEGQDASSGAPSAEETVHRAQERQQVLDALQELEPDRRAVFILHEIDGQPTPEVAEALGLPVNTAYSRLRLARQDFALAVQRQRAQRREAR